MSGAVERRWGLRLGGALLLEDEGLHLLLDRLGRHLCPSAAKDCLSRTVEATKRERKRETDLWQPAAAAVWESSSGAALRILKSRTGCLKATQIEALPSKAHAQPQLSNAQK